MIRYISTIRRIMGTILMLYLPYSLQATQQEAYNYMLKIHIGLNNDLLRCQHALLQYLETVEYSPAERLERYEKELTNNKEFLYLDYFVKTSNEWLQKLLKPDAYHQKITNSLMYTFLPHLELFCAKSSFISDPLIRESIIKLKLTLRKDLYKKVKKPLNYQRL